MTVTHRFIMSDSFIDKRNGNRNFTTVEKSFQAEHIDDLLREFANYLCMCGYTYVDRIEVKTDIS